MLAVVKPSPLRLWGFLLTVLGGALMAFGSIGNWAAISLGGSTENAVPTKGIDIWQGKATVALGALIVVGILALRFVRPERRNFLAGGIVVFGLAGICIVSWCLLARDSVFRDTGIDRLVDLVSSQLGLSIAEARREVLAVLGSAGIDVQTQMSIWVTLAGSVLGVAGGIVDLAWVRRKRIAGNTIDPDTLPARSTDAARDPGTEPDA